MVVVVVVVVVVQRWCKEEIRLFKRIRARQIGLGAIQFAHSCCSQGQLQPEAAEQHILEDTGTRRKRSTSPYAPRPRAGPRRSRSRRPPEAGGCCPHLFPPHPSAERQARWNQRRPRPSTTRITCATLPQYPTVPLAPLSATTQRHKDDPVVEGAAGELEERNELATPPTACQNAQSSHHLFAGPASSRRSCRTSHSRRPPPRTCHKPVHPAPKSKPAKIPKE